ncbi:uncharacterized protein DUF4252 [Gillisia mitskevichiae]|uniref:Uncharacterized protein DUF4252 n=1 Tax=Gillisia mitskevichiae TaxID=270921 RepID=A0A495PSY0_9FLAO|nr:DUF4252 domain-containing protein [Gillisia mitskevichiae]RKS53287.1 uncharacterized protein DUF4252 [Gillisia mitskevichiae]
MKIFKRIALFCAVILIVSCDNNQSLQEYYVDNQGDKEFVAVDVPTSLFANTETLSANQKKTLETVKKINILAIPKKEENQTKIDAEKTKITNILKDEKYQLLMKYGGGKSKMAVYFTGTDEAVDEIIVYGEDEKKGMGIARVLGDNMNPSDILQLVRSLQKGDIDMDGLEGISKMFASDKL